MMKAINLVKDYYAIVAEYNNLKSKYKFYEQKIFYIVYLNKCIKNRSILQNINELEELIENYKKGEDISPARKLIQKKFKEIVDKKIKDITNQNPNIESLSKKK
ncbi:MULTISPECIES: hypothetical protein [unclassified Staphylococcus]|uniref:hypothetical protein n=1 Tax=unclassified Staphylococcus TaxID=91994 RepID=UPI001AEBB37F|nr:MULTISPECIES: hypothetical protein [unclassified Staphylococcus]